MEQQKTLKSGKDLYSQAGHLLGVFFMCLGAAGMILMSASVPEITFSPVPLIIVSCIVICSLYLSNYFSKPLFYAVLAAIVVFSVFYIISDRELFSAQWQFLFGGMISVSEGETVDISRVALILSVLFSLIIFFFDALLKIHVLSFFITTAFILIPTVFGYSFPAYAIIITVIYQLALFILPISFKKSAVKTDRLQQRIRVKSTLFAVAAALSALAIAAPIAFASKEKTFDDVTRMENSALNELGLSPFSLLYNNEGNINKGNNEKNGVITLRLSADRSPTESVYMRGYFGGNYYGDHWDAPTDNVIFETLSASSDISNDASVLESVYNSLRYLTSSENNGNDSSAISLNVRNLNINRSIIFRPYNSSEENTSGNSYSFKYYEYKDLNMGFSDNDPENLISFRKFFRDYYADAYDNYTYVTAESIPLLKQLVNDNPLEDPAEITNFIIKTLDEHAEYTLNPGNAPEGSDTVDYFLFENHKGYCQQFASAAVLMYRLYGIPARYATGFRVKAGDFTTKEGSSVYEATVTDNSAHAWPEILLPEYGWVPVEVTPSEDRGISGNGLTPENDPLSSDYDPVPPATTQSEISAETEAQKEDTVKDDIPDEDSGDKDVPGTNASSSSSDKDPSGDKKAVNILPWLIPLIAAGAIVAAFFAFKNKKTSAEGLSFEKTYRKLRILLKNAPEPVTCPFYSREFPDQLKKAVPVLTKEEALSAYENILSALYSKKGADDSCTAELRRIYGKCSDHILPKLPALKKILL